MFEKKTNSLTENKKVKVSCLSCSLTFAAFFSTGNTAVKRKNVKEKTKSTTKIRLLCSRSKLDT